MLGPPRADEAGEEWGASELLSLDPAPPEHAYISNALRVAGMGWGGWGAPQRPQLHQPPLTLNTDPVPVQCLSPPPLGPGGGVPGARA